MTESISVAEYLRRIEKGKEGGRQVKRVTGQRMSSAEYRGDTTKRHKYNAKPTDGYASKKEAKRGAELELMQREGLISGLTKQPRYRLKANPKRGMMYGVVFDSGRVAEYRPDFEYIDSEGELIVEDVKGMKTDVYKLKKALLWAYYGLEVTEI